METTGLAIPPALLAEIQAEADKEHLPVAEVLRNVLKRGLHEHRARARELGLPDDQPLTEAYRQALREKIAKGVQSLREGRFTDGEAFMAQMDNELAELERQGP